MKIETELQGLYLYPKKPHNTRYLECVSKKTPLLLSPWFLGLTHPTVLDSCSSLPEHFLQKLDQWEILEPNLSEDPFLDLIAFQSFSISEMSCLLNFSYEYIEVAKIDWLLQRLFKALELKLLNCVFTDDVQKIRIKRQIKNKK